MRISDWSSDVCSSDLEGGSNFKIGRGGNNLTMIAVDPMHDLAILQGDVDGIPLPMRNTAAIWLGESVLAAGYPLMDLLGADLKVSTGNVSGDRKSTRLNSSH